MKKLIAAAILSGIMFSVVPSAAIADVEGPREEHQPWYIQADREGPREEHQPWYIQADLEGPREEMLPKTFAAANNDPEGPREERLLTIAG